MRKVILAIFFVSFFVFFGCDSNNLTDRFPQVTTDRGIFALTDAPHDELSVLQVELTELKVKDTLGNEVLVFSENDGITFILNMLDLQEINELLGSIVLPDGLYKELSLSYKNAQALDTNGNILTIRPQHFGTAKVVLTEPVAINSDNTFFEIDFDLNNSVFEIVSGPQGSLLLMPTLVLRTYTSGSDLDVDEFKGVVHSVESMSMVISINENMNINNINVELTDTTIVEVDEIIVTPAFLGFDLTDLIQVGNQVEVKGTLDVATNTVIASKIERKFENHGLESQGLVVGLGEGVSTFNLLVLDARDSGYELGSIQTINYDTNTLFIFTDIYEPGTAAQLALGQDIRVTGLSDDPAMAQKVKMRETKMIGTVASVDVNSEQIMMMVNFIEGISVDKIAGFENPVIVEFVSEFPAGIVVDDKIRIEGHFNRLSMGIFAALEYEIGDEDDDLDGEDGEGQTTVVGKIFSVISSSPLRISITRGQSQGSPENRTITVGLANDAVIFEKDRSVTTIISPADLLAGINSGRYDKLKAHGIFDSINKSLSAGKMRADIKKK